MSGMASKFAHLFTAKKTKAEGEDEERKQRDGESDEDYRDRMKKLDEDDADDDTDGKKKGKAAESEDKKDKDDDADKDKKAEADLEKFRAEAFAAGVKAEHDRWSGVLAHQAAEGRGVSALSLLDGTDMKAESITKTLASLPKERGASGALATLMAREPHVDMPKPGGDADKPDASTPAGFAQLAMAAAEKARPTATKAAAA